MTSGNGKAYSQANSPGLLGMGKTALTLNSSGGPTSAEPDVSGYSATGPIQISSGTSNGQNGSTGLISLGDVAQGNAAAIYDQSGNAVNNFTAQGLRVSTQSPSQTDD